MKARLLGAVAAGVLALVGTIVLIAYVRGVEERVRADEALVDVVVVQETIEEGTLAGDFGERVRIDEVAARLVAEGAITDLAEIDGPLAGHVAVTDLLPGEQLVAARLVDPAVADIDVLEIPDNLHQITVPLDGARTVGGTLTPGDHVAVFVSLQEGPGEEKDASTHLILHKVLVTRVQFEPERPTDPAAYDQVAPEGRIHVTLAVTGPQAERIVFGAEHGTVWLSHEPDEAREGGTVVRNRENIYR